MHQSASVMVPVVIKGKMLIQVNKVFPFCTYVVLYFLILNSKHAVGMVLLCPTAKDAPGLSPGASALQLYPSSAAENQFFISASREYPAYSTISLRFLPLTDLEQLGFRQF